MTDIVLVNIPRSDFNGPYLAPFLLKAVLQENGFTCKTFDWNNYLYLKMEDLFHKIDSAFLSKIEFEALWEEILHELAIQWIDEVKELKPKWFGLSFMSNKQKWFGKKVLPLVREMIPGIKIVCGGYMIGTENSKLGVFLKNSGAVDYFVCGDGEEAIVELLKGNDTFQGINSRESTPPVDLNTLPSPDYSDLNHESYIRFYIYTSRGCVFNCNYCVDNPHSKKFRSRKAELVYQDMLSVYETTGQKHFYFTDSLINGNPKQFRKLCHFLKHKGMTWRGYFACHRAYKKEDYKNAFSGGLREIDVGVESGSEKVRNDMGKNVSDELLYNTFKYASDSGIVPIPLLMVGYPTETEEDFQMTLDFLTKIAPLKNVKRCNPGQTFLAGPGMAATEKYNLTRGYGDQWSYKGSTTEVRRERMVRLIEHCKNINLEIPSHMLDRVTERANWQKYKQEGLTNDA